MSDKPKMSIGKLKKVGESKVVPARVSPDSVPVQAQTKAQAKTHKFDDVAADLRKRLLKFAHLSKESKVHGDGLAQIQSSIIEEQRKVIDSLLGLLTKDLQGELAALGGSADQMLAEAETLRKLAVEMLAREKKQK